MHHDSDTLITHGGPVKSLGNGEFEGYTVLFSGDGDPDLSGDYFSADTDFGEHKTTPIYYDHGFDDGLGLAEIGVGTLEVDDIGVKVRGKVKLSKAAQRWLRTQEIRSDEYEAMINQLIEDGKLGWSSGTAGHMVDREQTGKSYLIKKWPLGLDASLTPTPAEGRTKRIQPLKSYQGTPLKSLMGLKTNYTALIERVYRAFRAFFDPTYDRACWVVEVHDAKIVAEIDGKFYDIPYAEADGEISFSGREEWTEVEEKREWVPAKGAYADFKASEKKSRAAGGASKATAQDAPGAAVPETGEGHPVSAAAGQTAAEPDADDSPDVDRSAVQEAKSLNTGADEALLTELTELNNLLEGILQ